MSGDSSRKPSGSSTHSGTHSPPSTSGNAPQSRKLSSGPASDIYGMGGGNGRNGLKTLNTGWQVWGSSTPPASKRNASMSSLASVAGGETTGDSTLRPSAAEPWSARSVSGTWDDVALKKDFSSLDPQPPLNLRQTRQRQSHAGGFPPSRADERSPGSKSHHANLGKEANAPRYVSSKPLGAANYSSPQPPFPVSALGYDSVASDTDLALAMRGMSVEDDFNALHARQQIQSSVPAQGNSQMRGTSTIQQQRSLYSAYPAPEYGFYPPGRDTFVDYPYVGYSTADPSLYGSPGVPMSPGGLYTVPQSLHPSTVDLRQQPPLYFDYNSQTRPPSQFFFPPQGMMYPPPHSPMLSSQPIPPTPVTLTEKKYEMQYNLQQQLASRNLMFRAGAAPLPQAYTAAMDYGSQMMNAAAMYGHGASPTSSFGQTLRGNRRNDMPPGLALPRSPVLDEFRASRASKNKGKDWELRDITGFVVEFSGDQHGSRFIQEKLVSATSDERQSVFDEIVPNNTLQLMQDVFGNYVIQKLFEHGTQAQKTVLAKTMEGYVVYLSSNLYGCRVVQKAIESVLPDQQANIVTELQPHIMRLVTDGNGNHVIQKVIERVSPDRLGFVSLFTGHVLELASHTYGCRVLQRCLQHLPDVQTRPLLDELLRSYAVDLMQDQFGNYVIQFILEHGRPEDKALVVAQLHNRLLYMARHKFASNVCEKALAFADADARRLLIEELMAPASKPDGITPIASMMKDQYGNYVLQRALRVAEGDQKEALIDTVRPQLAMMRRYSTAYSKHLTSIERELEKLSPSEPAR